MSDRDQETEKELLRQWFILYCKDDDSHSLVPENDLICEENVRKGEEVNFSYNGIFYQGIVKDFGYDHDALRTTLDKLNAKSKPKRDSSFHDGRPRKAATICKSRLKDKIASFKRGFKGNKPPANVCEAKKSETASHAVKGSSSKNTTFNSSISENASSIKKKVPIGPVSCAGKTMKQTKSIAKSTSDTSSSSSDSSDQEPLAKKTKKKELNATDVYGNSNDSSDNEATDRNDSSSEPEYTSEQEELLRQLSKKKKFADIKFLLESKSKRQAHSTSKTVINTEKVKTSKEAFDDSDFRGEQSQPDKKGDPPARPVKKPDHADEELNVQPKLKGEGCVYSVNPVEKPAINDMGPGCSSDSVEKPSDTTVKAEAKLKCRQRRKFVTEKLQKKEFNGEYFKFKADDVEVERLSDSSNIFLNKNDFRKMKLNAKSGTAVARMLLKAVFTQDALLNCSVSGRPSCGKGANMDVRPCLHEGAVDAIITYAKRRAEKKKWPVPLESTIRSAMASCLCEERSKEELNAKLADD